MQHHMRCSAPYFCWLVFTRSGRRVIYRLAGGYIYGGLGKDDEWEESSVIIPLDGTQANNRKTGTIAAAMIPVPAKTAAVSALTMEIIRNSR